MESIKNFESHAISSEELNFKGGLSGTTYCSCPYSSVLHFRGDRPDTTQECAFGDQEP